MIFINLVVRGVGIVATWICREGETVRLTDEHLLAICRMWRVAPDELWWTQT